MMIQFMFRGRTTRIVFAVREASREGESKYRWSRCDTWKVVCCSKNFFGKYVIAHKVAFTSATTLSLHLPNHESL